ncbi:MAG: M28 family peptidase [Ignavibacteriales bacterium]|nr:M28 family peptidase [Ignavibacteriales bacterium]
MLKYLLVFIPFVLAVAQPKKIEKDARIGYESITASDMSAHLHFLASPELEGRETTFRGQKVAARYIASVFQKLSLKPIGDSGSYFQHFDLEAMKISSDSKISMITPQRTKTFSIRKDFLTSVARDTTLTAPVVFLGYMDAKLDSSVEAAMKGKIVMVFSAKRTPQRDTSATPNRRAALPRQFPGSLATFAITDEQGSNSIENLSAQFSVQMDKGVIRMPGGAPRRGFMFSLVYYITPQMADEMLKTSHRSFSEIKTAVAKDTLFRPLALDSMSVRIESKTSRELKQSENVIGLLEGRDPKLKDEIVIFTGHYDHLGITNDGTIYYGADDDGTGTTTVLELAEAFATNPVKPKRSVVFMTVTGEEKGLLGSEYYTSHPIIPLTKTIANLNTDMVGRVDKKHEDAKTVDYTYVIGSDKISTELDSILRVANKEGEHLELDYTFNDDKDPNQFYRRSDHFNFAKNGVPIIFFFTGVHPDYHRPTDTVDKILFDRMAKIGKLIYYTGWKAANFKRQLIKNGSAAGYK